ncbi:uncharacterized protein LOC143577776 [Bidens hawaiensis]|uniref:uncharacterized protein LOC143577776 n=1 Tax=Bidens hawaiensis TaxID=980011 RepID=UPI00404B90FD
MATSNSFIVPNVTINLSKPIYFHRFDHSSMILVSKFFDASGFGAWKRALRIAFSTKNKLGFINNTLVMPENEQQLLFWQHCNDMVISWILNTITHDIRDSSLNDEIAQIIWSAINSCYGHANGAKFNQLQKNLSQIIQGSSDIATYFVKMKSNWDELNAINTIPSCTCGVTHSFAKRDADQRLIQFLVGLNPSYDTIRSNILMMQPLPLSTVHMEF